MPYTRRQRKCSSNASPLQTLNSPGGRPKRKKQPSRRQLESDEYLGSEQKKKKKSRITKGKSNNTEIETNILLKSPASTSNYLQPPIPDTFNIKTIEIGGDPPKIGDQLQKPICPVSSSDDSDSAEKKPGTTNDSNQTVSSDHSISNASIDNDNEIPAKPSNSESTGSCLESAKIDSGLPKMCHPKTSMGVPDDSGHKADDSKVKSSETKIEHDHDFDAVDTFDDRTDESGNNDSSLAESPGCQSDYSNGDTLEASNDKELETSDDESGSNESCFEESPGCQSEGSNEDNDDNELNNKNDASKTTQTEENRPKSPPNDDLTKKKLIFESAARENKARKRGKNTIKIPSDVISFNEEQLKGINLRLEEKHECFTRFRDSKDGSEFPFIQDIVFSLKIDMPFLQKPVHKCRCPTELYGNYAIIDVATQWMFHRNRDDKFDLHLPACAFYLMSRKGSGSFDPVVNFSRTVRDWINFFNYTVIPLVVWHGDHFSIAYIVNAGIVFSKPKQKGPACNHKVACILYSNSMTPGGFHHKEHVSKVIRAFLNRVAKKRSFSEKNMKSYDIETCVQNDGYSCAYHTIRSRIAVLTELKRCTITNNDIDTNFKNRSFKYCAEDSMKIRAGIYELISAIHSIKHGEEHSYGKEFSHLCDSDELENGDQPFGRPKAEAEKEATRRRKEEAKREKDLKREQRRRNKEMLKEEREREKKTKPKSLSRAIRQQKAKIFHAKQKSEEENRRLDQWESKLGAEVSEEERVKRMKATKRPPERRLGDPCHDLKQQHDRSFRRACFNAVRATAEFASSCRYSFARDNDVLPRVKSFLFITDPIAEKPSSRLESMVRKNPVRIVVGGSKQEFLGTLAETLKSLDDIVFSNDAEDVDRLLLGSDRVSLRQFLTRERKKDAEEEREEDRLKRTQARDDITKSTRKKGAEEEQIRRNDGF